MAKSFLSRPLIPGVPNEWLALGAGAAVLWIWWRGGLANAANTLTSTAAQTVIDAAGGVVTGTVTGASDVLGIPTPADTTTDEYVARWIIDYPGAGYGTASKWSSAAALVEAAFLPVGSGYAPPQGTKLYANFPPIDPAFFN